MAHITEDDVLVWLFSDGVLPPDLEAHTRECPACSARLREGEQFRQVLRDPAVWDEGRSPITADSTKLEQIQELENRLQSEGRDADVHLRTLSPSELERHIAVTGGSIGIVRALVDRSYNEVEREPQKGEIYAGLAVNAASLLRPSEYSKDLVFATRGQAWRQRANAHRMSGRLVETLEDLDHAAAAFRETTVADPEIATLDYIRATVFYTQGRMKEARELLEDASATFRRFGDEERYRNSRLLLASVLESDGDRQEGIALLDDLLVEVASADAVFRGRVLHNLGVALLHEDQPRAESYFQQAHHCLTNAGLRTEALRALWNIGRAASQAGDADRAADILEQAYVEATALGLQIDIAMIALDRAELFLAREDVSLVQRMCAEALQVFRSANAPRFAAEAFAYLEAAARHEQLSSNDLTFVRDFFASAAAAPNTLFEPPQN